MCHNRTDFRTSNLNKIRSHRHAFIIQTTGRDKGAHYHELFLRGKRDLAHRIPRTKIKGGGPRKSARPAEEPNFYSMRYLPPDEKSKNHRGHVLQQQQSRQQQQQQQQAAYRMHLTAMSAAQTHSVDSVLEQALARQAYLNYAAVQARAAPSFAPLASPPAFPSPTSAGVGGGFPSLQDIAWGRDSQGFAVALRDKEMITVALLQRLRSRP